MYRLFLLVFAVPLVLVGCRDDILESRDSETVNIIYIDSEPAGADILLSQFYTNKTTPDSLVDLPAGTYFITLRLLRYADTTAVVELQEGDKSRLNIKLRQIF